MLHPRATLLILFAVIVPPLFAVGAVVPGAFWFAVCGVVIFLLLVVSDALRVRSRLAGISITPPDLVRLQKNREGTLELQIQNREKRAQLLQIGLAFPRAIVSVEETRAVELPAESEFSQMTWECTASRRGNYALEIIALEAASSLGFWDLRKRQPVRCELRVYPNLLDERKKMSALFLNRGHFGMHAQRRAGKGRDFEKLRDYVHGDSFQDIHWKATARRGKPVTKIFQVERTQEVYVVIDASRLSARNNGGTESVLERSLTAALLLGVAAQQQGDHFGVVTFSDRALNFLRAGQGQAHFNACREMLYTLHSEDVTPDFDELTTFLQTRLRKRALLIFLTSLDDSVLAESFAHGVQALARRHLVFVNMPKPEDAEPLFSRPKIAKFAVSEAGIANEKSGIAVSEPQLAIDESQMAVSENDLYQRLGGHLVWKELRELGKTLERYGVRFSLLENEAFAAQLVTQYLNAKAMQLL